MRIIKAIIKLFVDKGILYYLLVTAILGTIAVRINGIIIYLAYGLLKDTLKLNLKNAFNRFTSSLIVL